MQSRHLDDDAIDGVRQSLALVIPRADELQHAGQAVNLLHYIRKAEPPLVKFTQAVVVIILGQVLAQGIIQFEAETALGHLGGVLQLEAARGRIARVGEGLFPNLLAFGVQGIKAVERLRAGQDSRR